MTEKNEASLRNHTFACREDGSVGVSPHFFNQHFAGGGMHKPTVCPMADF